MDRSAVVETEAVDRSVAATGVLNDPNSQGSGCNVPPAHRSKREDLRPAHRGHSPEAPGIRAPSGLPSVG